MSQPATLPDGIAALINSPDPGTGPMPIGTIGASSARRGILRRSGGMVTGVGAGRGVVAESLIVGSGRRRVGVVLDIGNGVGVKVGGN